MKNNTKTNQTTKSDCSAATCSPSLISECEAPKGGDPNLKWNKYDMGNGKTGIYPEGLTPESITYKTTEGR